jgi:hypothetical protein
VCKAAVRLVIPALKQLYTCLEEMVRALVMKVLWPITKNGLKLGLKLGRWALGVLRALGTKLLVFWPIIKTGLKLVLELGQWALEVVRALVTIVTKVLKALVMKVFWPVTKTGLKLGLKLVCWVVKLVGEGLVVVKTFFWRLHNLVSRTIGFTLENMVLPITNQVHMLTKQLVDNFFWLLHLVSRTISFALKHMVWPVAFKVLLPLSLFLAAGPLILGDRAVTGLGAAARHIGVPEFAVRAMRHSLALAAGATVAMVVPETLLLLLLMPLGFCAIGRKLATNMPQTVWVFALGVTELTFLSRLLPALSLTGLGEGEGEMASALQSQ